MLSWLETNMGVKKSAYGTYREIIDKAIAGDAESIAKLEEEFTTETKEAIAKRVAEIFKEENFNLSQLTDTDYLNSYRNNKKIPYALFLNAKVTENKEQANLCYEKAITLGNGPAVMAKLLNADSYTVEQLGQAIIAGSNKAIDIFIQNHMPKSLEMAEICYYALRSRCFTNAQYERIKNKFCQYAQSALDKLEGKKGKLTEDEIKVMYYVGVYFKASTPIRRDLYGSWTQPDNLPIMLRKLSEHNYTESIENLMKKDEFLPFEEEKVYRQELRLPCRIEVVKDKCPQNLDREEPEGSATHPGFNL